jgi:hypothetical protein
MTPAQMFDQAQAWLFRIATFALALMVAVAALKLIGIQIPVRSIGHVELAYLSGALWLLRK